MPTTSFSPVTQTVLPIVYQPQAIFRVKAVTRCTATIPGWLHACLLTPARRQHIKDPALSHLLLAPAGHEEAVLHVSFSSCGRHLASGSGDTTVRVWDVDTETPRHTMKVWAFARTWNGKDWSFLMPI